MQSLNNDDEQPLLLSKFSNELIKPASGLEDSGGSYFSLRHLTREQKEVRTSSFIYTFANILKSLIGITFLVIPLNFARNGFYTGIISLSIVFVLNSVSTYLMIKARNVFKNKEIRNLSDLAVCCFGQGVKVYMDCLIISV